MENDSISWACRQLKPWLCREGLQCSRTHDREHQAEILERKRQTKKLFDPNDWYGGIGGFITALGVAGVQRGRLPRDLRQKILKAGVV